MITILSLERYHGKYAGGLAMCGPIGDFRKEIDYWGVFRSLFDVYYSDLKGYPPGFGSTTIRIPNELVITWYTDCGDFRTNLMGKFISPENILLTEELLYIAGATYDSAAQLPARFNPTANPLLMAQTISDLLNYNIFATNNAQELLGGNPYDNRQTVYTDSVLIPDLNSLVARYSASPGALAHLNTYQTSGMPLQPLVVQHTTGDPVIPYWQAQLYQAKVAPTAVFKLDTVERYGHCAIYHADEKGILPK